MGDTLAQIAGKALGRKFKEKSAKYLAPLQVGVGVQSGVEIAARWAQAANKNPEEPTLQQGYATVTLDVRKAFPSVDRGKVYEALLSFRNDPEYKDLASLIHFYIFQHTEPNDIVNSKGDIVGVLESGLFQGGPLTSFYFSITQQKLLQRLQERMRELEDPRVYETHQLGQDHNQNQAVVSGTVTAVADDVTITGEVPVIAKLLMEVKQMYRDEGLELNLGKSQIALSIPRDYVSQEIQDQIKASGINWPMNGFKTLGVYVESHEGRETHWAYRKLQEHFANNSVSTGAIKRVGNARYMYRLIRLSMATKFTYALRAAHYTTGGPANASIGDDVDKYIEDLIAALLEVDALDQMAEIRLHTPQKQGGAGIPWVGNHNGKRQTLLSISHLTNFIARHELEAMRPTTQRLYSDDPILITENRHPELMRGAKEPPGPEHTWKHENIKVETKEIVVQHNQHLWNALGNTLKPDPNRPNQARDTYRLQQLSVMNSLKGSGSALKYLTTSMGAGQDPFAYFSHGDFIDCLKVVLGINIIGQDGTDQLLSCSCGRENDIRMNPYHLLDCSKNQHLLTARHNEITNSVIALLKKLHPNATVKGDEPHVRLSNKVDILFVNNGNTKVIDVSVINPGCKTMAAPRAGPPTIGTDEPARARERSKMALYKRQLPEMSENDIIPFVVETTGRLGPKALDFINNVTGDNTRAKSQCLRDISVTVARFTGKCAYLGRRRVIRSRKEG